MSKDIMVIDYNKCVRYARGDERFAEPLVRFRCPQCADGVAIRAKGEDGEVVESTVRYLTPASFSARLATASERPVCTNHSAPVEMERF